MSDTRDPVSLLSVDVGKKLSDELFGQVKQDTTDAALYGLESATQKKERLAGAYNSPPILVKNRDGGSTLQLQSSLTPPPFQFGSLTGRLTIQSPPPMPETPLSMWQREREYRRQKLQKHELTLNGQNRGGQQYELYVTEHRKLRNELAADLHEAELMVEQYNIIAAIAVTDGDIKHHDAYDKQRADRRKQLDVTRATQMTLLERTKRKIEQRRKVRKPRKS